MLVVLKHKTMARKKRELGNDTYFTVYNSDLKLIKDPVKKILYSKIKNWIYRNEDKGSAYHFHDGHYWTFGTYEFWAGDCGLEIKTTGDHLRELVASGILKKGNYNRYRRDNTIWYRLATEEELKYVNFKILHYGKSKKRNSTNHSNETLYQMYQNGMIEVKNTDIHKENLVSPLLEDISEDKSEDILENTLEDNSEQKSDNNTNKIEDYTKIFHSDDILIHIDVLSKINIEDIPTNYIKLFINKFHKRTIDSINSVNDLFDFKCQFDVINKPNPTPNQINFCFGLITKYYNLIIAPQPAEQNGDKVSSTIASSPLIPLKPSFSRN
jgi:hypothetical protein